MAEENPSVFKSRAWITWMFVFGAILLGVGFIELIRMRHGAPENLAVPFISFGFILTLLSGLRLLKNGDQSLQDERIRNIRAFGLSWSWLLTFLVISGIFWADYLHLFSPDLQALTVSPYPADGHLCKSIPDLPLPERRRGLMVWMRDGAP